MQEKHVMKKIFECKYTFHIHRVVKYTVMETEKVEILEIEIIQKHKSTEQWVFFRSLITNTKHSIELSTFFNLFKPIK